MSIAARRRAAVLVPWIALAAVTVFAIAQVRARRESEPVAPSPPAPQETSVAPPAPDLTGAAGATETALDEALVDLEHARAETTALAKARAAALARAETAEARLAASQARVGALMAEVEGLRAAPAPAPAPPAAPSVAAVPAPAEDPVAGWLADVSAADAQRRARARERAAEASDEQIARLAALLAEDFEGRSEALARLAASLPAGDARDALVATLLADDAARPEHVVLLGARVVARPGVVEALLRDASAPVLAEALPFVAGGADDLDGDTRARYAAALAERLDRFAVEDLVVATRAAGLLRLPGAAVRLVVLADHEDPAVRAGAAYALSRVPDLDLVRADAVKHLPALLLDASPDVRTAAALLAETLVGGAVAYDPTANEAARREAVDAILQRLSP